MATASPPAPEAEQKEAEQYWGYLIKSDRTGSDKLKNLLRGLHGLIVSHDQTFAPATTWRGQTIHADRVAAEYRVRPVRLIRLDSGPTRSLLSRLQRQLRPAVPVHSTVDSCLYLQELELPPQSAAHPVLVQESKVLGPHNTRPQAGGLDPLVYHPATARPGRTRRVSASSGQEMGHQGAGYRRRLPQDPPALLLPTIPGSHHAELV